MKNKVRSIRHLLSGALCYLSLLVILACGSDHVPELLKEAEDKWLEGKSLEAVDIIEKVLIQYPDTKHKPLLYYKLGIIYIVSLNEPQEALRLFNTAKNLAKDNDIYIKSQEYIAEIFYNYLNNYDMAIVELSTLKGYYLNKEKEPEIQLKIANAYFKKGEYLQAIIEYKILLEKFSNTTETGEAIYRLATSYFILGKNEEAINNYKRFIAAYPKSPFIIDAWLSLASSYEENGELEKALKILEDKMDTYKDQADIIRIRIESLKKRIEKLK